jgi:DNA-binding SARP family transcriptional activator
MVETKAVESPRLAIRLFGPPRAEVEGAAIEVDTRKATALLAYLAVTGSSHSRDSLAALLWPDYEQERARAALRRTLSALKKALAGGWLIADRNAVELSRAEMWVDVTAFRSLLRSVENHSHDVGEPCPTCLENLRRAIGLYRGDFLSGFSLRDGTEFEEWHFFESEGLRRDLAGALGRLALAEAAAGLLEPALQHARRWLALDPLHEAAHQQLMRLHSLAGERSVSLRQYRDCVATLERELGVAPLPETTELYEAIRRGELASVRPERGPISPGTHRDVPELPLVGRGAEFEALTHAHEAASPDGRLVVIEGEAGAGKSRLCRELAAFVRTQGGEVLESRCHEGESGLAYAPVVACLRAAVAGRIDPGWLDGVGDQWLSECVRLLPELRGLRGVHEPGLDGPGARNRLLEGLTRIMTAACSGSRPGLVVIDDVHWADDASLELLAYLIRRLDGRPVCLALSWRTEAVDERDELRTLCASRVREGKADLVSLSRLDRHGVNALLESGLGRQLGPESERARRVYEETEGLPLFVVEYLAALKAGEVEPDATWVPSGGARELLLSRISSVGDAGRQILTAASVIGRSFDFETVRRTSGRSEEEVVSALEELMHRGIISELEGRGGETTPYYDFNHEKIRALAYEQTSLARRRLLHRRVAQTLASRGRREDRAAAAIARHFQLAGDDSQAAQYFKVAGEHAATIFANAEALSHLEAAVALGHPESARLHQSIGDVNTLMGRYGAAVDSYEKAAATSSSEDLPQIEHKLGNVHLRRGNWDAAEGHFEAALTAGDSLPPGLRARIASDRSLAAHRRGELATAVELATYALRMAEQANDAHGVAQSHNILGVLARGTGDPDAAVRHLQLSLSLAEELGDASAIVAAGNNLALAYGARGDLDNALPLLERALAVCEAQGDRHRQAALHNNLADLLRAAGRSGQALENLKESARLFAEVGEEGVMEPEIWKLVEW